MVKKVILSASINNLRSGPIILTFLNLVFLTFLLRISKVFFLAHRALILRWELFFSSQTALSIKRNTTIIFDLAELILPYVVCLTLWARTQPDRIQTVLNGYTFPYHELYSLSRVIRRIFGFEFGFAGHADCPYFSSIHFSQFIGVLRGNLIYVVQSQSAILRQKVIFYWFHANIRKTLSFRGLQKKIIESQFDIATILRSSFDNHKRYLFLIFALATWKVGIDEHVACIKLIGIARLHQSTIFNEQTFISCFLQLSHVSKSTFHASIRFIF